MNKFKRNKNGELTTQQIVLLIILITSFAIVLFFLLRMDIGKNNEKEICHNSVIMKGNSALPADSVYLNCHRSYVCLTKDGSCEKMNKPEIKKVKTENEVYEVLANEMIDCWWMFGEGKINYVGNDFKHRNYCSICSQLAFDDSLKEIKNKEGEIVFKEDKISKDKLYDYLTENNISGKEITYAEYLFRTNDIESFKKVSEEKQAVGTFGTINMKNQYFVVMGITSEIGNFYKWAALPAVIAGGAIIYVTSPVWVTVGGVILVAGGAGSFGYGSDVGNLFEPEIGAIVVKGNGIDNEFMAPTIQEVDSDKFKSLDCTDIMTYT